MANKIQHSELIQENIFQNTIDSANKLLQSIDLLLTGFRGLGQEALKYKKIILENSEDVKILSEENKKLNKITAEINKLEEQKIRLQSQTGKLLTELKVRNSDLNLALRQQVKEEKAVAGSMTQMSLELGRLRTEYRNLSAAQRNNIIVGQPLLKQIQELDIKLKKLDASIGNHHRNVGNYSNSIQSAAKELGIFKHYTEMAEKAERIYNAILEISTGLFKKKAAATAEDTAAQSANAAATEIDTAAEATNTAATEAQIAASKSKKIATEGDTIATETNTTAQEANKLARLGWIAVTLAAVAALGKYILSLEAADDRFEQWKNGLIQGLKHMSVQIGIANAQYTKQMQYIEDEEIKHIAKISELRFKAQEARTNAMETDVWQERIKYLKEFQDLSDKSYEIEIEHYQKIAEAKFKLAISYFEGGKEKAGFREKMKEAKEAQAYVDDLKRQEETKKMRTSKQILSAETEIKQAELKLQQDASKQKIEILKEEEKKEIALNKNAYNDALTAMEEQFRKLNDAEGLTPEHQKQKRILLEYYNDKKLEIQKKYNEKQIIEMQKLQDKLKEIEFKTQSLNDELIKNETQKKLKDSQNTHNKEKDNIQKQNKELDNEEKDFYKLSESRRKERSEKILQIRQALNEQLIASDMAYYQRNINILKEQAQKVYDINVKIADDAIKQEEKLLERKETLQRNETDKLIENNATIIKIFNELQKEIEIAREITLKKQIDFQKAAQEEILKIKQDETTSEEYKAAKILEINNKLSYDLLNLKNDEADKLRSIEERRTKAMIAANKEVTDAIVKSTSIIAESFTKQSEARQKQIDDELESAKKREDGLRELARKQVDGTTENLAFEQRKQAELEKKRQKEIEKQRKIELGMAAIKTYASLSEKGDKQSLSKTITEITELIAFISTIPAFAKGIIDFNGKGTETSDDNIVKISKGESIIKASATKDNKELLEDINKGVFKQTMLLNLPTKAQGERMNQVVTQQYYSTNTMEILLKEIKEEIKNKPESNVDFDKFGEYINQTIKRNNKIIQNHYKKTTKGLL